MDSNKMHHLAISMIPGIGNFLIRQLISYCGSAEAVFKLPIGKLQRIPGVGPVAGKVLGSINKASLLQQAEQEMKIAEKNGVEILCHTEKAYPHRLKGLHESPAVLFWKGNADLNASRMLAIVGTRQATEYGRSITKNIIKDLVPYQPIIVSGLAYGIDIQAHRAALEFGLPTIAVMASGMDVIYPGLHKKDADKMVKAGGLITEYRYGTALDPKRFPARNRIIAGISDATLVVEAAERGGALITAEIANSYNRDVFSIPGPVNAEFSAGCNNLIRTNKAHLIAAGKDIAYIMNWDLETDQKKPPKKEPVPDLDIEEKAIYKLLKKNGAPSHMDQISWETSIPIGRLASILLNLEFRGIVESLPGKQYKLGAGFQ